MAPPFGTANIKWLSCLTNTFPINFLFGFILTIRYLCPLPEKSMDLLINKLENGIRLVHQEIPGVVGHCGLFIDTGSVNEEESEHGIAHLIEHMLFKGTSHRKAYHILSRLEDVGGELNAYTTKEETVIHASFLSPDYERSIELIADLALNSVYPPKEIEKEKVVVIEEINSYRDNPAELIFDDFEEIIFKDQAIGRSILGKPETVRSFNRKMILDFLNRNYQTDRMVFCSVGNINHSKLVKLFRKYFSGVPEKRSMQILNPLCYYQPVSVTRKLDTWQCHCIIGNIAYNITDDRRMGMFLLNNILGGQGLNSRLNLSLREKNGLAYNVESNYNPYTNTGVFSIYFGTESQNLEKSIDITMKELGILMNTKLGAIQLSKAKKQIKGYLARGYENHESLMLSLGKTLLAYNSIDSFEDICKKIDIITSSDLLDIANEIFDRSRLSTLIYK
jgi:predicted Zn-dependent peptidase